MTMYRISFTTHLGRLHYDVPESEVMERTANIMACPGPFDVSVEMLDNNPAN